ncbi:MAG: hydantoinase B/oxoprolinase family protein [Actinobacteria bacterium]|nr:hydantoinase B/oxoprolinase family protein [Actinomycetota bacterium]
MERDLLMLEDVTLSLITERRVSRPWGLAGAEDGAPGENWLLPGGDETSAQRLPDKCTIQMRSGDVLRMLTPGEAAGDRSVSPGRELRFVELTPLSTVCPAGECSPSPLPWAKWMPPKRRERPAWSAASENVDHDRVTSVAGTAPGSTLELPAGTVAE